MRGIVTGEGGNEGGHLGSHIFHLYISHSTVVLCI